MFLTKVLEKININILCSMTFFRKSCHLWDDVQKYCRAGQTTDGNTIWRMRFEYWISKVTGTHTQNMQHLLLPHSNNGYANAPLCYVYNYIACLVDITFWSIPYILIDILRSNLYITFQSIFYVLVYNDAESGHPIGTTKLKKCV